MAAGDNERGDSDDAFGCPDVAGIGAGDSSGAGDDFDAAAGDGIGAGASLVCPDEEALPVLGGAVRAELDFGVLVGGFAAGLASFCDGGAGCKRNLEGATVTGG